VLFYYMGGAAVRLDYQAHRESGFQHCTPWSGSGPRWTQATPPPGSGTCRRIWQPAGNCRLLLQTTQSFYLIRPDRDGARTPTLQIPRNQIRALRWIPTNLGR